MNATLIVLLVAILIVLAAIAQTLAVIRDRLDASLPVRFDDSDTVDIDPDEFRYTPPPARATSQEPEKPPVQEKPPRPIRL